jgi:hypothetical protein
MADNKTKATSASVPAFIAEIADDARRADAKKLVGLMQKATGEKATMWGPSIVGFGSRHYVYESGREGDMPIVSFSPRKAATVLYVKTDFAGSKALLAKLGKHKISGGCIHVKSLSDVDETVLEVLVRKSAEAMRERS